MIYIFSSANADILGLGKNTSCAEIVPVPQSFKSLSDKSFDKSFSEEDTLYLDITGLNQASQKSALGIMKKAPGNPSWGIIDPQNQAEDPAQFFFDGACDYIGQSLVKKGIDKKRFAAAKKLKPPHQVVSSQESQKSQTGGFFSKTKLPQGKFPGWRALRSGTVHPFILIYVSVTGQSGLRSHIGESIFADVKQNLCKVLEEAFAPSDGLLWMETGDNCLFLVPPVEKNALSAIETSLKLVIGSRLIGIEKLSLSFHMDFTIAAHYGEIEYRPPGKTGEIVSETINYIFHLGAKRAETGRLTISEELPKEAFPEGLADLFVPAGTFEGFSVRHSKRFTYE